MRKPLSWALLVCFTLLFIGQMTLDVAAQTAPFDAQQRGARGGQTAPLPGTVSNVTWSEDGKFLDYSTEGKRYSFNLETKQKQEIKEEAVQTQTQAARGARAGGRQTGGRGGQSSLTGQNVGSASRGRQYTGVISPDEKWQANYENWNVVLTHAETGEKINVTTNGDEHIHFGTASWVYGEELSQNTAMWWTPDSKKLVFYRFDDTNVKPFHLVRGWSDIITTHYPEYYPKPGDPNPIAGLMIYDLATPKIVTVDVGDDPEQYVYNIRVSPDGKVMMFNWTNRWQNHLIVKAIDLETGRTRPLVEEKQETYQENSPRERYLSDNFRYLWPSDKTGFTHYELRDLNGRLLNIVTSGPFQTAGIQFVDEDKGTVGFTGYSSSVNPYYLQYHLVHLDGTNQVRVTTIDLHHSNFNLSPDQKWLVAQYEEVNTPPCTALYGTKGEFITNLAESDPAAAANLAETIKFKSDDGKFDIYAILYKPADFDPNKKYPVIHSLYGGPGTTEFNFNYVSTPRAETRRGYLVSKCNHRGGGSRGKAFLGATYQKLGTVEIQDHADAVRHLREKPYFDGTRVGITGSSYGGYASAMCIMKHPDAFQVAVNSSGVTDWRNYDTIYTERYMRTPQVNKEGYDQGAAVTFVDRFEGHMLILHGMVDDNVHPNNAFQLIEAIEAAGKHFNIETRFYANAGHGGFRSGSSLSSAFFDKYLKPNSN